MDRRLGVNFWSPLFLAVASAAFTVLWGSAKGWNLTTIVAGGLTLVFVTAAYIVARRDSPVHGVGGSGGNAKALGENSDAIGGTGGRGRSGIGGSGGDAVATGTGSRAKGGRGGDG